jgi:hypothetical protein
VHQQLAPFHQWDAHAASEKRMLETLRASRLDPMIALRCE